MTGRAGTAARLARDRARAVALGGLVVLGLVMALASCGEDASEALDGGAWAARADATLAAGDAAAARAQGADARGETASAQQAREDARSAWWDAAVAYRNAFRLQDPVPERRRARGLLAFRVARALSKVALATPATRSGEGHAAEALLWLQQAERLLPDLVQVWYERAALHDSEIGSVRDVERARTAYERYLAGFERPDEASDAERPRLERARERLAALREGAR